MSRLGDDNGGEIPRNGVACNQVRAPLKRSGRRATEQAHLNAEAQYRTIPPPVDSRRRTIDARRMKLIGIVKWPELVAGFTKSGAKLTPSELHALYLGALTPPKPQFDSRRMEQYIVGLERSDDKSSRTDILCTAFGYWNHLQNECRSGEVRLAPPRLPENASLDDVGVYARSKRSEINWYLRGLSGDGEDTLVRVPDAPVLVERIVEIGEALERFSDGCRAGDLVDLQRLRSDLRRSARLAGERIAALMTACDAVRPKWEGPLDPQEVRSRYTPGLGRVPNIGRNTICPCGSGKKWKRCCGKLASN